jgi:hypothetical protein
MTNLEISQCSGRACPPFVLVFAFVALFVAGCGTSYDATVNGTVTLDGQPLTKGNVAFVPVGEGAVANGAIQSDGAFTLHTATEQGLAPGRYKVTVVATDPPPPGDDETPGVLLTPRVYGDVKTTPLVKEVVAGTNTFELPLVSAP